MFPCAAGAEKYLKAFLSAFTKSVQKTHSLAKLIKDCADIDEAFRSIGVEAIEMLTDYAVEVRYPDDFYFPGTEETKAAVQNTETVKLLVLQRLRVAGLIA